LRRPTLTTIKSAIRAVPDPGHPGPGSHKRSHAHRRKPAWKGQLSWIARWLHTYLSMFSFLILFFFAATGFTLNHAQWFDSQARTTQRAGTLDLAWLKTSDPDGVAKTQIIDYLRRVERVRGSVGSDAGDFSVDDSQCQISFKGPAYEASAVIDRDTGKYQLTETRGGFVALLNDLHKGRDSGQRWSTVIDISAVFMAFVSLTGLTLIFYLTKRRNSALIAIAIGAVVSYLIYAFWVP